MNLIELLENGLSNMQVDYLHKSHEEPENVIYNITRASYGVIDFDADTDNSLLLRLLQQRHTKAWRFVHFTFLIKAPIVPVWQHLDTHRIGVSMYAVSGRRVPYNKSDIYVPDVPKDAIDKQRTLIDNIYSFYEYLRETGQPIETARLTLPMSVETTRIMQFSGEALIHLFVQRLHRSTQTQTREIVEDIFNLVEEDLPITCYYVRRRV